MPLWLRGPSKKGMIKKPLSWPFNKELLKKRPTERLLRPKRGPKKRLRGFTNNI